jgi:Zn-finger nucleic acid-binding protein
MKCPTCPSTDLLMSERLGIEIDYCPQCRGVWLDRGELDKIIERSVRETAPVAPAQPLPVYQAAVQQQAMRPPQGYDSGHGHDHRDQHHDGQQSYRGKKSIWKELFD